MPGRTHGKSQTPEYRLWSDMKKRCENSRTQNYSYYGGRGISVCREWGESFEAFYRDMGPRPTGMTIDRIDNDGNYEPGNCRWATRKEQCANQRKPHARLITIDGETRSIAQWARSSLAAVDYFTFRWRLNKGQDAKAALTTPLTDHATVTALATMAASKKRRRL